MSNLGWKCAFHIWAMRAAGCWPAAVKQASSLETTDWKEGRWGGWGGLWGREAEPGMNPPATTPHSCTSAHEDKKQQTSRQTSTQTPEHIQPRRTVQRHLYADTEAQHACAAARCVEAIWSKLSVI